MAKPYVNFKILKQNYQVLCSKNCQKQKIKNSFPQSAQKVMHQWKKKLKQKTVKSHSKPKDKHKKNWKNNNEILKKFHKQKFAITQGFLAKKKRLI